MTLLVVWLALAGHAENLLVNPGFETVVRGMPQAWQVFVAPMDGAEGRLDEQLAAEGQRSVKLHNPEPYAKEPANNWSQNIIADLGGQQLQVSGRIRTDEATEAALWLQCFRKSPFGVLKAATTSTDSPVYGTTEWTGVQMKVDVPEGTDFVVVRCVLKGSGTAWFDSIDVSPSGGQSADSKGAGKKDAEEKKESAKKSGTPKSSSDSEDPSLDEVFEMLAEIPDTGKAPGGMDAEVKQELLDAHRAMVDTNQTLRDMNVILMDQVLTLKDEIDTLRTELQRIRTAAGLSTSEGAEQAPSEGTQAGTSSPNVPVPPLVPHGANWEELVK